MVHILAFSERMELAQVLLVYMSSNKNQEIAVQKCQRYWDQSGGPTNQLKLPSLEPCVAKNNIVHCRVY